MFVSVLPGEQVEMILARDGKIQDYYVDMLHQSKTKGNIYKAVVHNVDPALQAAFVSYGGIRNGFLQVDEVHPEYYQAQVEAKSGKYPPLQKALKPGQELLVQIVKDPAGNKGAFLTTYISLPGRYFVLTPGREQLGVSRQIEDEKERARLKSIVEEFKIDPGLGLIVRTVSEGQPKKSLSQDLQFLKRLWKDIRKRGQVAESPSLVHEEKDLAYRAVRDYLTPEVAEIWVDHEATARQIEETLNLLFPRHKKLVKAHAEPDKTLFERFNLDHLLREIYSREVELPSGGRICIDPTEALTAIDINSGRIGGKKNFKDMAFKTNMEAAEAIARQIRLRDIGGQIVIDFIEMRDQNHVREVEKTIRTAVKEDKARIDVGKISKFGLMELVRQRLGTSALSLTQETCPHCQGSGIRRNLEWRALQTIKSIYRQLRQKGCPNPLIIRTDPDLAQYLLNRKRRVLDGLEAEFDITVHILFTGDE
ncbi:MAG: Rne/Rng family ribonuclease [Deltaproteobacteria bacterium]|nr:Rne/Rng family ribonuclease [Deltaproteobacteria bacterium]